MYILFVLSKRKEMKKIENMKLVLNFYDFLGWFSLKKGYFKQ